MEKKITKRAFILNKAKARLCRWDNEKMCWNMVKYIDGQRIEMEITERDKTRAYKSIGLITSLACLMKLLSDHKYHSFSVRHSAFSRSFELRLVEDGTRIYYQDMCDGDEDYIPVDEFKEWWIYDDIMNRSVYNDKLFLKYLHSLRTAV